MKTLKQKHLIIITFIVGVILMPTILSAKAEILPPISRTLSYKSHNTDYANVNHGSNSGSSYVKVQLNLGPPRQARISSFNIEWGTFSYWLPSTLKEVKIFVTLTVGSLSQTYTQIVWSGSDTIPWDIDGTWAHGSFGWITASGSISVTVKTQIKRYQWWFNYYQYVTSTLTWT